MSTMDSNFISHHEYLSKKEFYDGMFRKGEIWIERELNVFRRRIFWIKGRTFYTEVFFILSDDLNNAEQDEMILSMLEVEEKKFFENYDLSFKQAYLGL